MWAAAHSYGLRMSDHWHITIDVCGDGDEISGQVHDGTGPPKPFLGWLGLIGVLDGLLHIPSSTAETPGARE